MGNAVLNKGKSSTNNSCGTKGCDDFWIGVKLNAEENASAFIYYNSAEGESHKYS